MTAGRHTLSRLLLVGSLVVVATPGLIGCEKPSEANIQEPITKGSSPLGDQQPSPANKEDPSHSNAPRLVERWGIEVLGVRLSAAGY